MPARTRDEHGCDNEENDHRVLDGERIRDERTANIRGWKLLGENNAENPRNVP